MNSEQLQGTPTAQHCDCLSIAYDPEQVGDGVTALVKERWRCTRCYNEFVRKQPFHAITQEEP